MPLARGTAACGYTTILSLFWAAGMPITASIPKDYQVGFLCSHVALIMDGPDFTLSAQSWECLVKAAGEESIDHGLNVQRHEKGPGSCWAGSAERVSASGAQAGASRTGNIS
eukprot:1139884-Pelagomonas_calceolata.AAC.4